MTCITTKTRRQVGVVTYKNGKQRIKFSTDDKRCTLEQYNSRHGLKQFDFRSNGVAKGVTIYQTENSWYIAIDLKQNCGDRRIRVRRSVGKTLNNLYPVWLKLVLEIVKMVELTESELIVLHRNYNAIVAAYLEGK